MAFGNSTAPASTGFSPFLHLLAVIKSRIPRKLVQSDPLIPGPAISDIRYTGRAEKAPVSQSHLAITDKLKFWWFRYNGNLVSHVRYSEGRLYQLE